jgi:hypothetical protein
MLIDQGRLGPSSCRWHSTTCLIFIARGIQVSM